MYRDLDPKLLEVVRRARKKYRHLFTMRIPLVKPIKKRLRGPDGRPSKEHVVLERVDVLFRALSSFEFDSFANDAQYGDITESVVREAVLYPQTKKKWSRHPLQMVSPGHFEGVRDRIIEVSGFGDEKAFASGISMGRQEAGGLYAVIESFICKAFPRYTPFEVQTLPWLDQIRLVGAAEIVLGQQFPLEEILNPKANVEKTSRVPDFNEMPILTPLEVDSLRSNNKANLARDVARQAAEWDKIPKEERRSIAMGRRAQKGAIREAENAVALAEARRRRSG